MVASLQPRPTFRPVGIRLRLWCSTMQRLAATHREPNASRESVTAQLFLVPPIGHREQRTLCWAAHMAPQSVVVWVMRSHKKCLAAHAMLGGTYGMNDYEIHNE